MDESDEGQRTVWCGNLSEKITEEILYELFLQAAPLVRVSIPKDKNGKLNNYGFVTFKHLCSVPYATELLNGTVVYDKKINVKPRNCNVQRQNVNQQFNSVENMSPWNACTYPRGVVEPLEGISLLMQLGNHMLHNIPRNDFGTSYNQDRCSTPNERWDPKYRNENRDEHRPYKRYNKYRNDRYNSNRSYNNRRHDNC